MHNVYVELSTNFITSRRELHSANQTIVTTKAIIEVSTVVGPSLRLIVDILHRVS